MSSFLITRPEHDDTTFYLSCWSKPALDAAQKRGIKVIDLHRHRAVRSELEGMLREHNPTFVFLNGHGDDAMVAGHDNQPLLVAGENEQLLARSIVYALSCRSARLLGPASIQAGARSYSGYTSDFIFLYQPHASAHPLQDSLAAPFLEPSSRFVLSLLKGNTVTESGERLRAAFRDTIHRLAAAEADAQAISFLWWDLSHFASVGDPAATV